MRACNDFLGDPWRLPDREAPQRDRRPWRLARPRILGRPAWFDETLGCRACRRRGGVVEGIGCLVCGVCARPCARVRACPPRPVLRKLSNMVACLRASVLRAPRGARDGMREVDGIGAYCNNIHTNRHYH